MLKKIADELERFDASIDVINREQAKSAIAAALGAARVLLGAMTAEVFYMSEKPKEAIRDNNTRYRRMAPHFLRFAEDLDPDDSDALDKQALGEYHPDDDGTWTWSYQNNSEVWVEDRWVEYTNNTRVRRSSHSDPVDMENRVAMENMAAKEEAYRTIEKKHNIFWNSVNAVIVIPFFYKIGSTFVDNGSTKGLISHQANGFISFEFKTPKRYDREQLDQLLRIRESVADLIWKSHAWQDSCDGTNHVVKKFKDECDRAKKRFLPIKTGLFAPKRQGYENLIALIETTFRESRIEMKTYDGESDALGLVQAQSSQDIFQTQSIRDVHFAVFDITEKNLVADILVGVMFAECKPCLVLHENSEPARHRLVRQLTVRGGQDTDWLLYAWLYERQSNGEEYLFFKPNNRERKTWGEVWEDFLHKVRRISSTFQIAADSTEENTNGVESSKNASQWRSP
ncbi:hypothetical protein IFO70_22550 [Phormidium tenue FACHB-886]|nr:hypothetical protein [Phormidium tenue FACHB-886]